MYERLDGFEGPLAAPRGPLARRLAAALLRSASLVLGRLARRLRQAGRRPSRRPPELEFYAEAGAPEGALYLDGEYVGHLPGVTRL